MAVGGKIFEEVLAMDREAVSGWAVVGTKHQRSSVKVCSVGVAPPDMYNAASAVYKPEKILKLSILNYAVFVIQMIQTVPHYT